MQQRERQFARVHPHNNLSPNPYLLPVQNGGPPGAAAATGVHNGKVGGGGHHHLPYHRHPARHDNIYTTSSLPTAAVSAINSFTPALQSNHGSLPPHHFHQHHLHQQQHPHNPHHLHRPHNSYQPSPSPNYHQTHGSKSGSRMSPIPPPSKFMQPAATTSRRSTSPVSHLVPMATGSPRHSGSRSPPPVPGRVSPNSLSRGGHVQNSRHQTQL